MVTEMSLKEKLKENAYMNAEEEKKFCEWKIINLKYLSLKDSKMKGKVGQNVFEKFCEMKGLERKKEHWEREIDERMKMQEIEIEEIVTKKKSMKSRKKKLELLKDCKEKLFGMIEDWKETPDMEEERNYRKLKENLKKERMVEVAGRKSTGRKAEARPEMKKKEDLRKTTPRKKVWKKKMPGRANGGNSPMAKSFARKLDLKPNLSVKQMAERLETLQQINLSTAEVCGQLTSLKFSKPHYVYSSSGVQMQIAPRCTGPTNQWGESSGDRPGSRQPHGQSDDGDEQDHEQK